MSGELQPVEIVHVRDHAFEKRSSRGCAVCGKAKTHYSHHGYPPSLNALGDGNRFAYRAMKETWEERLAELLGDSELPTGLGRVTVEGVITVPDRKRRDQGNHRFLLEKALGDALVAGGWLDDDDWARYEFGGLQMVYERGTAAMRLFVFPSEVAREDAA